MTIEEELLELLADPGDVWLDRTGIARAAEELARLRAEVERLRAAEA